MCGNAYTKALRTYSSLFINLRLPRAAPYILWEHWLSAGSVPLSALMPQPQAQPVSCLRLLFRSDEDCHAPPFKHRHLFHLAVFSKSLAKRSKQDFTLFLEKNAAPLKTHRLSP